jgi:hypothetical protein
MEISQGTPILFYVVHRRFTGLVLPYPGNAEGILQCWNDMSYLSSLIDERGRRFECSKKLKELFTIGYDS